MSIPTRSTTEGVDEETALLPKSSREVKRRPLPKGQISILLLLQLAEPIAAISIYPYINQLVSELDITGGDPKAVGYYAGLIESLFFLAESCTILQWSRLSDTVGRRPVLLIGLAGLSVSMLAFGLSKTYWALVASRCLAGLLNGNIGVMKAAMAELTDPTNMAQGFALIPITWCVGATIGPFVGGVLSRPHDNFPNVFSAPFWQTYPYFLPCAATAAFSALAFLVTFLFLKETVVKGHPQARKAATDTEGNLVLQNVTEPHQQGEPALAPHPKPSSDEPVPLRDLLGSRVIISVSNYFFLAILEIAMLALQPLFYSTPIELGGLGLSPSVIGVCLSAFGLVNGSFQALFFARIVARFGPKRVFVGGMLCCLPIFTLFPVINLLAKRWGLSPLVWIILGIQLALETLMDMAFGCIFMFITSAAPNKRSLGAVNGLSQTTASIARAVGPAASTSLFAFSVERNLLGGYAVYLLLLLVSLFSLLVAAKLPDNIWNEEKDTDSFPSASDGEAVS